MPVETRVGPRGWWGPWLLGGFDPATLPGVAIPAQDLHVCSVEWSTAQVDRGSVVGMKYGG